MRKGFSLVELSIVLVILGLLVGGVLAGQSLIRASELRAVGAEYQRHLTASMAFRDKYFAIPGDIANATSIWSGTSNGDANGIVSTYSSEQHRFWQHLALAGLIEGTYSGVAGGGGAGEVILRTNAPASKLASAGWGIVNLANFAGDSGKYAMDYGNAFIFGAQTALQPPQAAALKTEEAWNLDNKIDDGKPASGKIIALGWNNTCAAADDGTHANNDLVASYLLTSPAVACSLYFRQLF